MMLQGGVDERTPSCDAVQYDFTSKPALHNKYRTKISMLFQSSPEVTVDILGLIAVKDEALILSILKRRGEKWIMRGC